MVVPEGWKEQKEFERDVKYWTQRFDNVRDGKETWDAVYSAYMGSSLWEKIKRPILKRANGQCEKCHAIVINDSNLDVHHKTYERVGGREKPQDLEALCYSCHQKADRKRERIHEEDRLERLYYAKVRGFAKNAHGELWEVEYDEDDVEQEWLRWLFKKYCKQEDERYELDYDGRVPDWFEEMVWDDQIHFESDDEYY